jgi:hypothetical protein
MTEMRRPNVGAGVLFGVVMAVIYSVLAMLIFLFTGGRAFEAQGTTLDKVLLAYFAGGIFGGALGGLCWPLATWRWGSTLLGVIAGLPVGIGILMSLEGFVTGWSFDEWFAAIFTGVILGAWGGYSLWTPPAGGTPSADRRTG